MAGRWGLREMTPQGRVPLFGPAPPLAEWPGAGQSPACLSNWPRALGPRLPAPGTAWPLREKRAEWAFALSEWSGTEQAASRGLSGPERRSSWCRTSPQSPSVWRNWRRRPCPAGMWARWAVRLRLACLPALSWAPAAAGPGVACCPPPVVVPWPDLSGPAPLFCRLISTMAEAAGPLSAWQPCRRVRTDPSPALESGCPCHSSRQLLRPGSLAACNIMHSIADSLRSRHSGSHGRSPCPHARPDRNRSSPAGRPWNATP